MSRKNLLILLIVFLSLLVAGDAAAQSNKKNADNKESVVAVDSVLTMRVDNLGVRIKALEDSVAKLLPSIAKFDDRIDSLAKRDTRAGGAVADYKLVSLISLSIVLVVLMVMCFWGKKLFGRFNKDRTAVPTPSPGGTGTSVTMEEKIYERLDKVLDNQARMLKRMDGIEESVRGLSHLLRNNLVEGKTAGAPAENIPETKRMTSSSQILETYNRMMDSENGAADFIAEYRECQEMGLANVENFIIKAKDKLPLFRKEAGGGFWLLKYAGKMLFLPKLQDPIKRDPARVRVMAAVFELRNHDSDRNYFQWKLLEPAEITIETQDTYRVEKRGTIDFGS